MLQTSSVHLGETFELVILQKVDHDNLEAEDSDDVTVEWKMLMLSVLQRK